MRTHKSVMMATGLGRGPQGCCGGRLRTRRKSVAGTDDNLRCCSGYRGRLRTTKVALVSTRHS